MEKEGKVEGEKEGREGERGTPSLGDRWPGNCLMAGVPPYNYISKTSTN